MNQYCQDILKIYIQIRVIDVYYFASIDLPHSLKKHVEEEYY